MNTNTRDITSYTKKSVVFVTGIIYRSACGHPFVLGIVLFLLLLYRFLPHLFGFLVSSSPIIICTALLLGVLLSFGQPNIPDIEQEETAHGPSSPPVHAIANDLVMEEDKRSSTGRHVESKEKVEESAIKEAKFSTQVDSVSKSERGTLLSVCNEKEESEAEATISAHLPLEVDKNQIRTVNTGTSKEGVNDREHYEKAEIHELLGDAAESAVHAYLATSGQNETEVPRVETHEPAVDSQFDSSLVSSWNLIDNHDVSESDSDHAESSSPDASMADIIPMLDELHPLLDSEDPQPVDAPMDDSHSLSGASLEDGGSDDGSGEEEAENQVEVGEEEAEEEEEETKEENEDGAAMAVKWTEDDAKNLMVLGTSELERNQRLETLIAKRRAWKSFSLEAEKNLIDLDASDTVMDELSHIQLQIPPISTTKRNPFDLPYDSQASISLPPIPGSAPSVLLPRQNPFDLPLDQPDESGGLTGVIHQVFAAVPQRDMFFRRHESFALGASFTGEFKQEKHDVKLRPYFVTERTDLEEASYAHFQRQLSDKSDSKLSSVLESESVSSVADQDDNNELSEQHLHQESESELVSSLSVVKHVKRVSNSSDEIDSVDPLCTHKEINVCSSHNIDSSSSEVLGTSIHDAVDDFTKLEDQSRHDLDLCSATSYGAKSDVAEENYSRSSSCSSELSMKSLSTKSEEGSTDFLQPSGDSSNGSSISVHSVCEGAEVVNGGHVVEPLYDSSPSAIEKSLSNIASLEEELLHGDKGSFKSTSSLSSETVAETSGTSSLPVLAESNIFSGIVNFASGTGSMGEMPASDNGGLWVAPLALSCVEENESRYREVGEIREQDVIQVEFTEVDEYGHPASTILPESAIEQVICYSSSTETDSSDDSMGMDFQFSEQETVIEAPHSDMPGTSDYFISQVLSNEEPPLESLTVQASVDTVFVEQHVEILPSIPEENSEYFKHEEKYENASTSLTNDELIGSPNAKLSPANFSGAEHESFPFHETSTKQIGDDEVLSKQENGLPEHVNGSGAFSAVHASVEESKRIDDEALLLELDAIGDFHVEEFRSSDGGIQTIYKCGITEKKIGGSEILLSETHLDLVENSRDLQEVEARSLEDIHMALKLVSEGTSGIPSEPMGTKCILDPEGAEARISDSHMQVSDGKSESSKQLDELHIQDVEAGCTEDLDLVSKHSECTSDCLPKLIVSSVLEEVEARSVGDIDLALKQVCEGTDNDLSKHAEDGCTEVEVVERNVEHFILEAQTSGKIEPAGVVGARETDQSVVIDAVGNPHGSSSQEGQEEIKIP